jgi:hypothetical protein
MDILDPRLELGGIILGTFSISKLHTPGAETDTPKLFALTGQMLNLH